MTYLGICSSCGRSSQNSRFSSGWNWYEKLVLSAIMRRASVQMRLPDEARDPLEDLEPGDSDRKIDSCSFRREQVRRFLRVFFCNNYILTVRHFQDAVPRCI